MVAVDKTLRDICDQDVPFGGKVVCFCGDFRQFLPVLPGRPMGTVVRISFSTLNFGGW